MTWVSKWALFVWSPKVLYSNHYEIVMMKRNKVEMHLACKLSYTNKRWTLLLLSHFFLDATQFHALVNTAMYPKHRCVHGTQAWLCVVYMQRWMYVKGKKSSCLLEFLSFHNLSMILSIVVGWKEGNISSHKSLLSHSHESKIQGQTKLLCS